MGTPSPGAGLDTEAGTPPLLPFRLLAPTHERRLPRSVLALVPRQARSSGLTAFRGAEPCQGLFDHRLNPGIPDPAVPGDPSVELGAADQNLPSR